MGCLGGHPMKKVLRYIALSLLAVLIAIQFVRSPRNAGVAEGTGSIIAAHKVPDDVRKILQRACYDCHSNSTKYPWYASVQPSAWWLAKHVREGKAELNFSEFATYDTKRTVRKLQAVADEVHERHMPLKSYLLMHAEAKLTDAEVALVATWAEDLADEIESR
jgi:uncharacterized membrane protein